MEIEAGGSADALNRSSQAAEPLSPIVMLAFGGCGKSEKKYVGIYVEEVNPEGTAGLESLRSKDTLELRSDGTYKYRCRSFFGHGSSTKTGEWTVVQSNGKEDIEFTPFLFLRLKKTRKRGYCLEDANGSLLVRED